MGLWDKAKDSFKELHRTDKYDDEYARQFIEDAQHDIEPGELRKEIGNNVPLDYLDEDEQVQYLLRGFALDVDDEDEGNQTAFIVTDKKLIFLAFELKSSHYTISYSDIIGVSFQEKGRAKIQVNTAGHTYKVGIGIRKKKKRIGKHAVSYIQQRKEETDKNSESQKVASPLDEIDKLDELRQKGAITEEEYEQKKQELLDKL